ncbi:TorF family putative porin [Massilia sp. GCM10023247]|uniref:TorF family putative porin n=1 Tax=Massilia sp. GCM10023247 TaxID=3252643 RepID=UPI00361DFADC
MKAAATTSGKAAALVLAMMGNGMAQAQEAPAAEHSVAYNAALTSEYRYRGLSQSRFDPALQGGVDYTHNPSGLYAGTWLSTIKWTRDLGGDGNVEVDLYAGKRGQLSEAISYDVGGLYYWYPSNHLQPNANTFELYGQVGFGPAYLKYSHATTNLFGTSNSKQSGYLDLGANLPLMEGLLLNLHVGRQRVKHNGALSYTDYKVGLTKDLGVASVSLAWIRADTENYLSPQGRNLGKSAAVLSVSKTF